MLQSAMEIAVRAHRGQFRRNSYTPYAFHALDVPKRMINWGVKDEVTLAAGCLHDVEEENPGKRYMIDFLNYHPCGPTDFERLVYNVVMDELTFIPEAKKWPTKEKYIESFMTASIYALTVKIADRLCNTMDFYYGGDPYAKKYFAVNGKPIFDAMQLRLNDLEELHGIKVVNAIKADYKQTLQIIGA